MSKDLHIYTNGQDPFVFMVKKVVVYVHAGPPPLVVVKPPFGDDTQIKPDPTPLPADYTDLKPTLGIRVTSPYDHNLSDLIDGHHSDRFGKVIVQSHSNDDPPMSQLESVFDSLSSVDIDDLTAYVYQIDED
jgi:hypothetical protein